MQKSQQEIERYQYTMWDKQHMEKHPEQHVLCSNPSLHSPQRVHQISQNDSAFVSVNLQKFKRTQNLSPIKFLRWVNFDRSFRRGGTNNKNWGFFSPFLIAIYKLLAQILQWNKHMDVFNSHKSFPTTLKKHTERGTFLSFLYFFFFSSSLKPNSMFLVF